MPAPDVPMSMLKSLMMGRTALPLAGGTGYISVKWMITCIPRKYHSAHTVGIVYQLIDMVLSELFDSVSVSPIGIFVLFPDAYCHI